MAVLKEHVKALFSASRDTESGIFGFSDAVDRTTHHRDLDRLEDVIKMG